MLSSFFVENDNRVSPTGWLRRCGGWCPLSRTVGASPLAAAEWALSSTKQQQPHVRQFLFVRLHHSAETPRVPPQKCLPLSLRRMSARQSRTRQPAHLPRCPQKSFRQAEHSRRCLRWTLVSASRNRSERRKRAPEKTMSASCFLTREWRHAFSCRSACASSSAWRGGTTRTCAPSSEAQSCPS